MDTNENGAMQTVEEQTTEQQTAEVPAAEQQTPGQPGGQDSLQILTEIRDMTRKELTLRRINTGAVLCVCAAILIVLITVVPKAVATIENVNNVAVSANESLRKIDLVVDEMSEASKNINQLVKDNAEPLSEAVNNMTNVDFDGLNKAIEDLQTTVGPMASFFGRFQ